MKYCYYWCIAHCFSGLYQRVSFIFYRVGDKLAVILPLKQKDC